MDHRAVGYERGLEAGHHVPDSYRDVVQRELESWRKLYPTMQQDMGAALIACDQQRLACEPDYCKFPELKGHLDLLLAEREGFREASGLSELEMAHHFSAWYFNVKWLNARHLARWDIVTAPACTNVFIPGGRDGVTIGDNRDIRLPDDLTALAKWRPASVFARNKDGVHWGQGGVSAAVVLDDEPACSFPADPFAYAHLMPREFYENVDVMIEFLVRFNEFWGPGNKLLVDKKLNAVIFEKSNCRVASRKAGTNGSAAITACAYLDPALSEHQLSRARKAAALKGERVEKSLDVNFHLGAGKRYRRLTALTNAAAKGKPDIWEVLQIVADHAVPYPDRVCLAGDTETGSSDPKQNWSVTQHASVITGPYRRALYRSVQSRQNPRPVYQYTPKLMLGPGIAMQPEWQADIDAGRCELAPPQEQASGV